MYEISEHLEGRGSVTYKIEKKANGWYVGGERFSTQEAARIRSSALMKEERLTPPGPPKQVTKPPPTKGGESRPAKTLSPKKRLSGAPQASAPIVRAVRPAESGPSRELVLTWARQDVDAWDEAVRYADEKRRDTEKRLRDEALPALRVMKEESIKRLINLSAMPYGFRLDAQKLGDDGSPRRPLRVYLFIDGEPVNKLGDDPNVLLVSFTSDFAMLRHTAVGKAGKIDPPGGTAVYQVDLKANYLSNLLGATYTAKAGQGSVGALRDVLDGRAHDESSEGKDASFGLRQIVFQTDINQDRTMRMPLEGHMLVTGSPGSGKTTIAIQRIVYAIREQREELELRDSEPPVFTQRETVMFVRSRVLRPYILKLLVELSHPDVRVEAFEEWRRLRLREAGLLGNVDDRFKVDTVATDSIPLGQAKARADVLEVLLAHAADFWGQLVERAQGGITEGARSNLLSGHRLEQVKSEVAAAVLRAKGRLGRGDALAAIAMFAEELREWVRTARRGGDLSERQADALRAPIDALLRDAADVGRIYATFPGCERWRKYLVGLGKNESGVSSLSSEFRGHVDRKLLRRTDEGLLCWLLDRAALRVRPGDERLGRGYRSFQRFPHVLVDEAQDFTEVEMHILVSLAKNETRCVTATGDLAQSLDPLGLSSWERSGLVLGSRSRANFRINYRQTSALGALCRAWCKDVLGVPADFEVNPKNPGTRPVLAQATDDSSLGRFLVEDILHEREAHPEASIVILGRDRDHRERVLRLLREPLAAYGVDSRLSDASDLQDRSVVHVTDIAATKGLEFDAVYLLEVDRAHDFPEGRAGQFFYVGMSRSCRRLVVTWCETLPTDFSKVRDYFETRNLEDFAGEKVPGPALSGPVKTVAGHEAHSAVGGELPPQRKEQKSTAAHKAPLPKGPKPVRQEAVGGPAEKAPLEDGGKVRAKIEAAKARSAAPKAGRKVNSAPSEEVAHEKAAPAVVRRAFELYAERAPSFPTRAHLDHVVRALEELERSGALRNVAFKAGENGWGIVWADRLQGHGPILHIWQKEPLCVWVYRRMPKRPGYSQRAHRELTCPKEADLVAELRPLL
jgi:DNA helicase-2/ATP-dependent DNA helicase PcrA